MRLTIVAAAALAVSLTGPALAQVTPAPAQTTAPPASAAPAPADPPSGSPRCGQGQETLSGIGRLIHVEFTGAVFGAHVCATVANLAFDGFTARIADAPSSDAVVTAALSGGGGVTLPLEGATITGAGPYVVSPGGVMPSFGGDTAEQPRVVLAYAGQRVLLIATTPVGLVDLARALRDHPGLFDADAIERAVIIASGPDAVISVRPDGSRPPAPSVTTPRMLLLIKRG
ncbi:MAG: hypothetical protein QOD51_2971 [Candidatus Eremiobacteraeota bacterium]|jgi:hypothetical protein|nr:hypothetical protein [Candidatus Eremiobacteraeota bacterium]